ncbi:hypothetical protein Plhal304r1_c042g0120881 [Plasmopara halstedii]
MAIILVTIMRNSIYIFSDRMVACRGLAIQVTEVSIHLISVTAEKLLCTELSTAVAVREINAKGSSNI